MADTVRCAVGGAAYALVQGGNNARVVQQSVNTALVEPKNADLTKAWHMPG